MREYMALVEPGEDRKNWLSNLSVGDGVFQVDNFSEKPDVPGYVDYVGMEIFEVVGEDEVKHTYNLRDGVATDGRCWHVVPVS